MKYLLLTLLAWVGIAVCPAEALKVASLHPLLSEMAQEVGGGYVEVVDLFPANMELHEFAPGTREVSRAAGVKLVLACGKGTEPYLQDLRESLPDARFVELGAEVPDVQVPGTDYTDPHWWNLPDNMKRASRTLARALAEADPEHAEQYYAAQRRYAQRMDKLTREARLRMGRIAPEKRCLVTAHAAMTHFCQAFGFTQIALYGIAKEGEGDVAGLAGMLKELRARKVGCLFTELNESPRLIETFARELPATVEPLILDGVHPERWSYERIFRFNLDSIERGLGR